VAVAVVVCDKPYPMGVIGGVFFVVFIVVGSLVMLTLFVGVVTTASKDP
jgi:hypothetical protein